ncbi:putative clathrin assembly protein [Camellia lanceoleosa]|uniref:Clathrin assembly protein n=1 Tax=Camellia lanceoleosa TaxID=1840588 RepID=A0ACC0G9Q7_9ERIC|nr:putative clathrin assembly protein [Camellia lanceoleosa]
MDLILVLWIILAIEYKKSPEVQEANLPSPSPPEPELVKVKALVAGSLDLLGLNDPVPSASELDEKNALALAIVPVGRSYFSAQDQLSTLSFTSLAVIFGAGLVTSGSFYSRGLFVKLLRTSRLPIEYHV